MALTEAMFFKVRSTEGKQYVLRDDERTNEWTLQSGLDGDALLGRPSIELISVQPKAIREAESKTAGCTLSAKGIRNPFRLDSCGRHETDVLIVRAGQGV